MLPGTTAVWGSSPGAATAMVLMADAFGADARLVAFMQYLRVIFVSMAAALIARCGSTLGVEPPPIVWFPPIDAGLRGDTGHRRRRRGCRPAAAHSRRHLSRPDDRRHGAAPRRLSRAAVAAMAARRQLCGDRLDDRPQFHAHDPLPCGPRAAADHRLDPRADRVLRGLGFAA